MPTTDTITATTSTLTIKPITLGAFNGSFAGFQHSFWNMLRAFGVDSKVAHKCAMDFGSDLGRAMRENADVSAAVSKANKNNESYLKLSGKSVRVANSPAMEINRVCVLADALFNEGLVNKRALPANMLLRLTAYLSECEDWAADKTFVQ